jgi:hypothetical protein
MFFAESCASSSEQDVTMQSAVDDSSNISITMREPHSESLIDLSTCQENSSELATTKLSTMLETVSVDNKAVDIVASRVRDIFPRGYQV